MAHATPTEAGPTRIRLEAANCSVSTFICSSGVLLVMLPWRLGAIADFFDFVHATQRL
jgi:hypothetical protein